MDAKSQDVRKRALWDGLREIYLKSVSEAQELMKGNPDIHIYFEKDGWDNVPDRISGCSGEELSPEDVLDWLYENGTDPDVSTRPFIYTDEEIGMYRRNRSLLSVEKWKSSIEFYKGQIRKYEARIAEALAGEKEDGQ